MSEKQQKILYMCTCGGEDAEKASICIGLANAALALEEDVSLVLMGKSVYLAQKGYANHIHKAGERAPLKKLMSDFMELGGKLLVCKPCIEERNMELSDFIEGAELATGTTLNMAILESDKQLTF
ncbi:MAG: DsrE family protein [Desulfobacula sp.]|uniref:DsrE family protein n=1 Tax=Desulfobacula sp. TaxID=2593537 RepID=UPI0025C66384|nr:DsrE family protein [Desulfobacula sp.]MBC2704462.1 DsrE family protein [Desulfobacula sp.]MBW2740270.1 DsrE family protein [Deltaproteobacteria bacterium]MCK5348064.1 DsrE family protein [Desulfobacula sp.]